MQAARDRIVRDALAPLAAGIAILQLVLAFGHGLLPTTAWVPLMAMDAASAAFFAGFRIALGRRTLPERWAHPVAALWGGITLLIVLAHLRLLADPLQTLMLMLLVIGAGSLFLSFPWFASFTAASLLGWIAVMASLGFPTGTRRYGFAVLGSIALSAVVLGARLRTLDRLESLRVQGEARRLEVEDVNRKLGDALAAVLREESLHRTIAEHFPNGALVLFNKDLQYTLAGGRGLPALGLSREGLEGKTMRELFPPEICDRLEPAHRAALNGQPSRFDLPLDAQIHQVHTVPVRNEAGEVFAGLVMTQDVSEARRAAEACANRRKRTGSSSRRALFPCGSWTARASGSWPSTKGPCVNTVTPGTSSST